MKIEFCWDDVQVDSCRCDRSCKGECGTDDIEEIEKLEQTTDDWFIGNPFDPELIKARQTVGHLISRRASIRAVRLHCIYYKLHILKIRTGGIESMSEDCYADELIASVYLDLGELLGMWL